MRIKRPFRAACVLAAIVALVFTFSSATAPAAAPPQTAESRLLNLWLDLQLVAIFYPDSTPATFWRNVARVAKQLNQPHPVLRHGDRAADTRKYPVGTVVVARHPPARTLVLYSRNPNGSIWELLDPPTGHVRVFCVLPG